MAITGLTPGALATQGSSTKSKDDTAGKGFDSLKTEDFLSLLISELQNQNPLEPMDNNKILDQFTSINSLSSTQKLTDTLSTLNLSQTLSSASGLIGKIVKGKLGDSDVSGVVEKAIVENGQVFLQIGDSKLPIGSVTEVDG
jgi:flagellar basal-body rod modification protein FlgD